jgi:hypothetical protein
VALTGVCWGRLGYGGCGVVDGEGFGVYFVLLWWEGCNTCRMVWKILFVYIVLSLR